ncbi:MAG: DUF885 family protein [Xanthomonadales bacterium]|nr:DUF885 family protein [Xanthomonadales bacterium]
MTFPRRMFVLIILLLSATPVLGQQSYDDLLAIHEELTELSQPERVDGVPDFSNGAVAARRAKLGQFPERLKRFDVEGWPVEQQVDYLLVWSRLNGLWFDHRVMKPWARDPLLYLYHVHSVPWTEVPESGEEATALDAELRAVPGAMAQARANLTQPVGELARLTIFLLENFDGVGSREPYRDEPPDGTIGWYEDLCERLRTADSPLVERCRTATAAVAGYRDWLAENLADMDEPVAIGRENFNWYLTHVRLLPYDVDDLLRLGGREFHRYRYLYMVERNRNESLPELSLTRTAEQHAERTRQAEARIRRFIREQNLLDIPGYMPEEFETDTYWSPRALNDRHFWEELQFRNALNNHIHASVPGHRFDAKLREHLDSPIRRAHGESARAEGWATYLEELFVQAGITDDNPRARELFYTALIKRGSRIFAEIGMHTGEMSVGEANAYMQDWVPYMEEDLGRYDLIGYLRRPGLGSMYITGKMQIEQLISERSFQQGEAFDLGDFHNDFLSRGIIPVTLIRWEMTGLSNEVRPLWQEVVGKPFADPD